MPTNRSIPFAPPHKQRPSHDNSLLWIFAPLERDANYMRKRMFGSDAAYLDGLLCLVVADRGDPWNGLLVCTSHEHHATLIEQMQALRPHPILGKWLYVPQDDAEFEATANSVVERVQARDPRIGIEPKPRPRKSKAKGR